MNWERPDLNTEDEEIVRTAESEGLDLDTLRHALKSGELTTLTEQMWSQMENTDSYDVRNISDAIKLAESYKRDWRSINDAYHNKGTLPAPIVILKPDGAPYLVGGNTRLMIARAHRLLPQILLAQVDQRE